jgi:pyocin large subunit-like protein
MKPESADPDKADTDGDGYSDGEEFNAGTNPLDPKSHPVKTGKNLAPIIQLLLWD